MAFVNLGFELAGTNPGDASGWARAVVSTAEELADFGGTHGGWDAFEAGWSNDAFAFAFVGFGVDVLQAPFTSNTVNPKTADDFESGWNSNEGFAFGLSGTEMAVFLADPFDSFDLGWGLYSFGFADLDLTLSGFTGSGTAEPFETGWTTNQSFKFAFVGYGTDLSVSGYPEFVNSTLFEPFENVWPDQLFSVNPSTNVFTVALHVGQVDGDQISIISDPEGVIPDGLSVVKSYFLKNVSGGACELSLTMGGATVDVLDAGVGNNAFRADPRNYWYRLMATI